MAQDRSISDAMRHALAELAINPGEATYRKLRALILNHPGYVPYSEDLRTLSSLYGEKRYEQVLEKFRDMMPDWMLNPSAGAELDCIECEDGSTLWFDITELMAHLKL
jgi:hypothetical protein